MSKLVELLKAQEHYHGLTGATEEQIAAAQGTLGLSFSDDYKEYISGIGVASFAGHELTGICPSPRLNVIDVTEKNRKQCYNIPSSWYVLEEANIDQIVIWQDANGDIYKTQPDGSPVKIARGIADYINL